MINQPSNKSTILVLDDEPEFLQWLFEYLEEKGYTVESVHNIADAIEKLEKRAYRFFLADLSVPVSPSLEQTLTTEGLVYRQYPGLYVAHLARDKGYRARQVVVYSVHDVAGVQEVADRIGVRYILKGRPRALKAEIDDVLQYDPTDDR